ncbi:hypothetical protein V6N13_082930 [Hibiscus sabdariffa]|uniref:Uncharacterized protein n=1 Tax=Hibiscus sabdariffa TaxID=183260 RepID=A0ABR2BZI2_9ROSI
MSSEEDPLSLIRNCDKEEDPEVLRQIAIENYCKGLLRKRKAKSRLRAAIPKDGDSIAAKLTMKPLLNLGRGSMVLIYETFVRRPECLRFVQVVINVIHKDFMKAVRKLNESKKLESSAHHRADFGRDYRP